MMWRERELRRVAEPQHREPAVARDEADGEHAARERAPCPQGRRWLAAGSADAQLMRKWWNL